MNIKTGNISEIVAACKRLLHDKQLQNELINNQEKLINKYSAKSLVEYVVKYMVDGK